MVPKGIVSWNEWIVIVEHMLENWLEIPKRVWLLLLRSLSTSRLKMRMPGMADDTIVATTVPRFATSEPR